MKIDVKYSNLLDIIKRHGRAVVAFSGGVDSSFLCYAARKVLGDDVLAITINSPLIPAGEVEESREISKKIGLRQLFIEDNVIDAKVAENSPMRCYHCKKLNYSRIKKYALDNGFSVVLDGSNSDDQLDYRPGFKALNELKIVSPLREAELTKEEIRELSRRKGLPTWDKPAYACLATRIPYGEIITVEKMRIIEKAEAFLKKSGFRQFRVRMHGVIARIEVPSEEREKMFDPALMDQISIYIKSLGFLYVCLELEGYKTGSMNRTISEDIGVGSNG